MFVNFLFPKRCLGCGKNGKYFCSSCIKKIKPLEPQIYSGIDAIDGLFCIFPYQGIIRKAILKLKYNFVSDLANEFNDLAARLLKLPIFDCSDCLTLIPIPLHWHRKNWRGFNQVEILGKRFTQRLKINFSPDLLVRVRATKPQARLKGKQAKQKRKENVKDAFRINPKYSLNILISQYPNILLFDDVWTTGATMKECARVLKNAGAKKVFGLTLTRKIARRTLVR